MSNKKKIYKGAYQEIIDLGDQAVAADLPCYVVDSSGTCTGYCDCNVKSDCNDYTVDSWGDCEVDVWTHTPTNCRSVSCASFLCTSWTSGDCEDDYSCG